MSEDTRDMLTKQVESVAETVREYARQIDSGEYGNRWTIYDADSFELGDDIAPDAETAVAGYNDTVAGAGADYAERLQADEPTIGHSYGNETPISEWPLAVEVKVGRPLTVLITAGGPHIEIVHDLSDGSAKLAGYWGCEKVYRHGTEFQTVLDYLTDSLYDEVPEEYK